MKPNLLREAEDSAARTLIENTLRMFGGNVTKSAEYLGTTRRIFSYRMKGLGIEAENCLHHKSKLRPY